jgi:alpha-ribazole phosphatase
MYLIRHPQPRDTLGVCYGRGDVAVDAQSVACAARTARDVIAQAVWRDAQIFSSPSTRCMLLARELAAPRAPTPVDELLEMNFGSWEGKPWNALPRDQLDAWARDVWGYRPGGVESAAMIAQRWLRWTASLRGSAFDSVVAVTHAGVIRVALACAGVLNAATFAQTPIAFGSVHCIELDRCDVRVAVHA